MRGVSLAETMLAFLIVSLALLGLVAQQIYAHRAQAKVSLRQRAGVAAASQMAELQAQLLDDFTPRTVVRQRVKAGGPERESPDLEYAATVAAVPGLDTLLDVAVSVYFTDAQGPQQVDLRTRCLKP